MKKTTKEDTFWQYSLAADVAVGKGTGACRSADFSGVAGRGVRWLHLEAGSGLGRKGNTTHADSQKGSPLEAEV